MQRILAAVDFSSSSSRALEMALGLARAFQASLRVVYVDPERFAHLDPAEALLPRSLRTPRLERELAGLLREAGAAAEGVEAETRVLQGSSVAESLLEEAAAWGASLIVAGTHGRSALQRLFLGSVSSKLLQLARVPVLVVPPDAGARPLKILAAVDGGPATEQVLRTAGAWARALGAELTVLHVLDQFPEPVLLRLYAEEDLKPELRRLLDQMRGTVHRAIETTFDGSSVPRVEFPLGIPYLEVCRTAEAGGYGLIVVGAHQRQGLLDVGNTALRIAHHAPCPILLARPPAEASDLQGAA
jgi:nucleotide-binding universal stress UspA family protein